MKSKSTFWQKLGIQDWFLKKDEQAAGVKTVMLTPNDVFNYIVDKFRESTRQLSFADRVVFYHEYIICFSREDYHEFMEHKRGIFGLIVQESVKRFYEQLKKFSSESRHVEPSSSKWVFRFVPHPDYAPGDMGFIGKLLPGSDQPQENLRVTFIPRQTGIAQTFDINNDILKGFNFYSEGYYEVPYDSGLALDAKQVTNSVQPAFARFEAIVPEKAFAGRKIEFMMKDRDIIISGTEEQRKQSNIFRVPTDWVNTPHLRIKYDEEQSRFMLASFGEKTLLNEQSIERSTEESPVWTELPLNSRIMLNGIVGINIFKS